MKYYNRHIVFWLLLLGTLGLVIFLGWGIINPPIVLAAAIGQLRIAPDQPDQIVNNLSILTKF